MKKKTIGIFFGVCLVMLLCATASGKVRNMPANELSETATEIASTSVEKTTASSTTETNSTTTTTTTEVLKDVEDSETETSTTSSTTKAITSCKETERSNTRYKNLGKFNITVYCPSSDNGRWGYQTANGTTSKHLKTCAVDPNVIPLGSTIRVGDLTLYCCDTGSKVKGNVIDIFYDGSESSANGWVSNFGTYQEVILVA